MQTLYSSLRAECANPKNEYFSDGISEELLNDLSQVAGLRVAGRTSSFSFKGKSATIEDIGKALGVRTVLEGSVQREGDRVRITAQLIDATNDFHLWSQTYDREISDIFVVEDEICRAITQELTRRLLPDTASHNATPAKSKINPAAYTAYLQGLFFWNKRNKDDMERAADFFKQAIALEPDYAAAHAGLASVYCVLFLNGQRRDIIEEAKDETAAALRLDPNNSWALLNEAGLGLASWNWIKTDTDLRRVLERNPNNADAEHVYATFLLTLDIPEAALAWDRRAGAVDPLAPIYRTDAGLDLRALGRDEEAIAEFRTALTLDPNYAFALGGICMSYADTDKLNDAGAATAAAVATDARGCGPYKLMATWSAPRQVLVALPPLMLCCRGGEGRRQWASFSSAIRRETTTRRSRYATG